MAVLVQVLHLVVQTQKPLRTEDQEAEAQVTPLIQLKERAIHLLLVHLKVMLVAMVHQILTLPLVVVMLELVVVELELLVNQVPIQVNLPLKMAGMVVTV